MYQILVSLLISDQTIEINNLYCLINYTFDPQDWCLQIQSSHISRVFLQRQLWIVNYYVKSNSNLSNENIKTGFSREMIFEK